MSADNDAGTRAEIAEVLAAYEAALLADDVEALNAYFHDAPTTVRYGVAEQCVGMDAIRAYRKVAPPIPADRRLLNTVIATFGRDLACVSTEFTTADPALLGRQSQTWLRIDGQWLIVAAHVSQVESRVLKRY